MRFKDVPPRLADDVLRVVVDLHGPTVSVVVVPQLIEALRTENADVRLRIQRTLLDLQRADYSRASLEKGLAEWLPAKDESAGDIDARVRVWQAWWFAAKRTSPVSP